jgi:hypothetical protein
MDVQTHSPVARQGAESKQLREKPKDALASARSSLCRDVFVSVHVLSRPEPNPLLFWHPGSFP